MVEEVIEVDMVRRGLSREQRDRLVDILNGSDLYKFVSAIAFDKNWKPVKTSIGWVQLKKPEPSHPMFNEHYLPIGFIGAEKKGAYYAELVNINKSLENYHSRLREIYLSIK